MKQHKYGNVFLTVVAVAAIMTITACVPDDLGYQTGEGREVTILATCEQPGTKADIGEDLVFNWTAGDQIAVWAGTTGTTVSGQFYTSAPYVSNNRFSVQLSGTRSGFAFYPATIADDDHATSGNLQVTLPSQYDITEKSPTFSPLPMLAINHEGENLYFCHLGGLLRLNIAGAPVGTSKIQVSLGRKISGQFAVQAPAGDEPETDYYIVAGEDETPVTFIIPEVTAEEGTNFVLNLPVPTGTYSTVTIAAQNAIGETLGDPVTGNLYKKGSTTEPWVCERAHGKHFSTTTFTWTYELGTLSDVTVDYTGTMFTSVTASLGTAFTSYKWRGEGASRQEVAVPYKLQYSTDGGVNWTDGLPDWMTAATTSAGSIAGEALPLEVEPQHNTGTDPHRDELSSRTAKSDFDLSTLNVATGGTVARTTANCYVVSAPGTYKFPLVYGNGVKNGAVNESAYYQANPPANGTNLSFLTRFKDHLDQGITTPYIASQHSGTMTAEVLWTDAIGLVTLDEDAVTGTGENTYISFSVPEDRICQGNALIALKIDGVIVWSWHIWVTDEDLTALEIPDGRFYISPVNTGWCEGRTEVYTARTCKVRAVQTEDDGKSTEDGQEATVSQTGTTIRTLGNNPLYQWGRKDPSQAAAGFTDNSPKVYYTASGFYEQPYIATTENVTLGMAIQNPCAWLFPIFMPQHDGVYYPSWNTANYGNLWDTEAITLILSGGEDSSLIQASYITKSIYDPTPVGFKVPSCWHLTGMPTGEWQPATDTQQAGLLQNGSFFPAVGMRPSEGISYVGGTPGLTDVGVLCTIWYGSMDSNTSLVRPVAGSNIIQTGLLYSISPILSAGDKTYGWISRSVRPVLDDFTAIGEGLNAWE